MGSEGMTSTGWMRSGDKVATALVYGIFGIVVLILTLVLWVVFNGLMNPTTPRSYHERQIKLLEEVVVQKPKVAAAWADLARALIVAKQYNSAASVLDRGDKALGKDAPELALERARLALVRGQADEALRLADKALKVTSAFRERQMAKFAEKAVTVDPRTIQADVMAEAAEMKGSLLAAKKSWTDAEKAYSIAIYEKPGSADYLVTRASVYIELREYDKARADADKALAMIPGFEPALTVLKRIDKGSGK
ncbi:MAG: tetratricopeptide repeat protein [Coriobacteriia bacterium]|nr:tetratricopeptide repeat protein [Coriobacteriia bacterium]